MTDVSFEEEKGLPTVSVAKSRGIADALVKTGFVQTELQANILLIVFALLIAGAAVFVFLSNKPEPRVPTPKELIRLEQMKSAGN